MKIIGKRIFLKPIKKEQVATSIIDPSDIDFYEVYGVGDEVTKVKEGDHVLYEMGTKFNLAGMEGVLLEEKDIICIL